MIPPSRVPLVVAVAMVTAAVAAGVLAPRAGAQTPELQVLAFDQLRYPKVELTVAVPPTFDPEKLSADNFAVAEDGVQVETDVRRDEYLLDVVLVVDTSGSMQGAPLQQAVAAAGTFLDRLDPEARVSLIGFGDVPTTIVDLTTDHAAVRTALGQLAAVGETALYDALGSAAGSFDETLGRRRVIVLLSDGKDSASTTGFIDAVDSVRGAAASLFAIPLWGSESDFGSLRNLTVSVGGRWLPVEDASAFEAAYAEVAARLENRWVLSWATNRSGPVEISASVAFQNQVAAGRQDVVMQGATLAPGNSDGGGTPAEEAVAGERVSDSWLDDWGRPIGIAALAGALVAFALTLRRTGSGRARRTSPLGLARERVGPVAAVRDLSEGLTSYAEQVLDRRNQQRGIDELLDRAAINLRPGEFVVLTGGGALILLLLGVLASVPAWGVLGAVAVVGGSVAWVKARADRRANVFVAGLDDALLTMANSLRAGQGLTQALDTVARETEGVTSEEFARVVVETQLGRDVVEAMSAVDARVGHSDFSWVVKAIAIHRELGGDLAEVLDNVATTIRDRNRVRTQIKALSAEGRLSGMVLFGLPLVMFLLFSVTRPEYFSDMFETNLGRTLLAAAVVAMAVGGIWMRRIIRLKF